MQTMTRREFINELTQPGATLTTPDGSHRLDVEIAADHYEANPESFHTASDDNPDGNPAVHAILTDGPWWVRRRGRPSTGTRVDVRLPDDLLDQVDAWADRHNLSRAEAIRELLGVTLTE